MARHPKGLPMLFATEMWERFSFYTMQALLVLYATAHLMDGGLGLSPVSAMKLYGLYVAASYCTPLLGGYVADRFIGMQRSVLIGGLLMAVGQFLLMNPHPVTFSLALISLALGNGFFKPCISSLLGCLYEDRPALKDSGYSIFYVGINLGAFFAGLVGGALQESFGFKYAFLTAGLGMLFGLGVFFWGQRNILGKIGAHPTHQKGQGNSKRPLSVTEKKRMAVIGIVSFAIVVFFAAFWQQGASLTLYAEWHTDRSFLGREIPTPWFFSLNPLFILVLGPIAAVIWKRLANVSHKCRDVKKLVLGFVLTTVAFAYLSVKSATVMGAEGVKSSMWVLVIFNGLITAGELCVMPVALSLVSKIAPEAYVSRMMSVILMSTGFGAIVAGQLGALMETLGPSEVFAAIAGINALIAVLLLPLSGKMEQWCDGEPAEGEQGEALSVSA